MTKRIFIPWSGGVDSTALILRELREGNHVTAAYFAIGNNRNKTKRELAAIKKLRKMDEFKEDNFHYLGKNTSFAVEEFGGAPILQQPLIWLNGIMYSINSSINEVALAYVQNDDAISYLDDIRKVYRGFQPLIEFKLPPLRFPLMKEDKNSIYRSLPVNVRDAITWCEGPGVEDNCGTCHSCKRMKFENCWDRIPVNVIDLAAPLKVAGG